MTADLADELLPLACRLAVEAGDAALSGRRGPRATALETLSKSTLTDLVTAHDRAAERAVVGGLLAARLDDAIVGEEGTDRPGTSEITWYVDPIDGTTNFVYDLPTWAVSIAAADGDGTLVGAVYAPPLGELFAAARGHGATLNGERIRCTAGTDLSQALVATGFSYDSARRRRQAALVERLIGSVRDIRRLGSAALDLCYVAAGRFDVYYEDGLNIWDFAAGELIAREAGCRTSDFGGAPIAAGQVLAASPALFDQFTALLAGTLDTR